MARRSTRGGGVPYTIDGRRATRPWWVSAGWFVTWDRRRVYGWRQWRGGHVTRPFSFPHRGRSYLTVLGDIERTIAMLQKSTKPKVDGAAPQVVDPGLAKRCPALAAHLCQSLWDDGSPRQTSTLSVFTGDGAWKACLRDRENHLCLWVAATSFDRLTGALETALGDENTVWRHDRQVPGETASRTRKGKGG